MKWIPYSTSKTLNFLLITFSLGFFFQLIFKAPWMMRVQKNLSNTFVNKFVFLCRKLYAINCNIFAYWGKWLYIYLDILRCLKNHSELDWKEGNLQAPERLWNVFKANRHNSHKIILDLLNRICILYMYVCLKTTWNI